MRATRAGAFFLALGACSGGFSPTARPPTTTAEPPSSARSIFGTDYALALATAKAQGKLLFVDAWAPWCHTCLSMRELVLEQPAVAAYGDRYVFVAVDTDLPASAGFVERYPMRSWPTFFVIDPASGAVLAMVGGSASLAEMTALLDAGSSSRSGAGSAGVKVLVAAHDAYAKRDFERAADLYEEASGTGADSRRSEALLGAMRSFSEIGAHERCVAFGLAHVSGVTGSSAPIDFTYYLHECAKELPAGAARDEALGAVRARITSLTRDPPRGSSVDDRADLFAFAAEIERDQGRVEAALAHEGRRLALLDEAVRAAATPEAAHVHDYERMGALLALGRGEEARLMFEERTRQMPESYEPHARLASTLLELERPREALVALERAIARAYGPRRLRYMKTQADTLGKLGTPADLASRVKVLEAEVRGWEELPTGQRDSKRAADARARLESAKKALAGSAPPF